MTRAFGQTGEFSQPKIIRTPEGWEYCPVDPEAYGGPDCDREEIASDVSKLLSLLGLGVKVSTEFLKQAFANDLKNGLDDAQRKINSGQAGMIDAGNRSGGILDSLATSDSNLSSIEGVASSLQSLIASDLASLSSLGSQLGSLNTTLASQNQALANAQARLDYTMNRANYPFTLAGIKQQRSDSLLASQLRADANMAVLNTQQQISGVQAQSNAVGESMNGKIGQLDGVRASASSELANRNNLASQLDSASRDWQNSSNLRNEGIRDAQDTVKTAYDRQQSVLEPMREGGYLLQGGSQVANSVAKGEYLTATGDAFNAGYGSVARLSESQSLAQAQGLVGSAVNSMVKAGEVEMRSPNFDSQRFIQNGATSFGDATVGYSSAKFSADNLGVARDILANGRTYEGLRQASYSVGPMFESAGTTIGTVSSVGGFPVGTAIGTVAKTAGATLAQGMTTTAVEFGRALSENRLSAPTSEFQDRGIGKPGSLRTYPGGDTTGQASAPFIAIGGTAVSLSLGAKSIVDQKSLANQASYLVEGIASTGAVQSLLQPVTRIGGFRISELPTRVEPGVPVTPPAGVTPPVVAGP